MLMATAWLGATTGLLSKRSRTSQRAAIWSQSVASELCASWWRAAIAAWSWYGPMGPRGKAAVTSAVPEPAQKMNGTSILVERLYAG